MSPIRIYRPPLAADLCGLIVLGVLGLSAPARAGDAVYWSIGVAPASGVAVGVSDLPPVVDGPPRVVYTPPQVVYTPLPMYTQPLPVSAQSLTEPAYRSHPGRGHRHGHGHRHGKWHDREHGKGGPPIAY